MERTLPALWRTHTREETRADTVARSHCIFQYH